MAFLLAFIQFFNNWRFVRSFAPELSNQGAKHLFGILCFLIIETEVVVSYGDVRICVTRIIEAPDDGSTARPSDYWILRMARSKQYLNTDLPEPAKKPVSRQSS